MTSIVDTELARIERRILWLSTAIVHHANRVRPATGLKVGGHQASSASLVSIMTSLWFRHLRPEDRVSVKPHASPVLHAINYLLGELDARYLTTLREFGSVRLPPNGCGARTFLIRQCLRCLLTSAGRPAAPAPRSKRLAVHCWT